MRVEKIIMIAIIFLFVCSPIGFSQELDSVFKVGETEVIIGTPKVEDRNPLGTARMYVPKIKSEDPKVAMVQIAEALYNGLNEVNAALDDGGRRTAILDPSFIQEWGKGLSIEEVSAAILAAIARYDLQEFWSGERVEGIDIPLGNIIDFSDRIQRFDAQTIVDVVYGLSSNDALLMISEIDTQFAADWSREAFRLNIVDAIEGEIESNYSIDSGAERPSFLQYSRLLAKIIATEIINKSMFADAGFVSAITEASHIEAFAKTGFEAWLEKSIGEMGNWDGFWESSQYAGERKLLLKAAVEGFKAFIAEIKTRTVLLGTDAVRVYDLMSVNPCLGEVAARQSTLKSAESREAERVSRREVIIQMDTRSLILKAREGVAKTGRM